MIGSFWNLCRACPSMPVDKLHSEYRSTYRWHEYTGGPEVVRKPPVPNQFASSKVDHFFSKSTEDDKFIEASINEPPLPRRKKCPELAYRSHEFMSSQANEPPSTHHGGHDRPDAATTHSRARSEERGTPSRRSKSEGPPGVANGRLPTGTGIANGTHEPVSVEGKAQEQAGESSGLFKKTINKLSTEYRLQFVWPHVRRAIKGAPGGEDSVIDALPRKSLSMGAIKAAQAAATSSQTVPTVHKKRTTNEREANAHELEPLVNDVDADKPQHEKRDMATVVEQKMRATKTEKERFGFEPDGGNRGNADMDTAWYKEVLELRKKAGEYRNRGWGVEMNPDLYNKQQELWDQVSRRSSLSALSLASSVRPITKEEKEKENNKKSSPTKPHARGKIPGSARPVEINKALPDGQAFSRSRKDNIRHHLERTTGPDMEEGALLPSPTREKLMPAIPRSKADSPQRGSPQKTGLSRHGSPQKGSPQKSSPKKMSNKGRSQSVGPTVAPDASVGSVGGGSPKRQIRSGSTTTAPAAVPAAKTHNKKTPTTATTPSQPERRPRPTTLPTTTNHSRSKSSSVPHSGHTRVHSAPPSRPPATTNNINNNNHINNYNNNNNNNNNLNNTNQTHPPLLPTKTDQSNNNSIPNHQTITSSANTTTTTTSSHPSRAKLTLGTKIGSQNRPRAASSSKAAAVDSSANSSASSTLKKEPSRKSAHSKTESGTKLAGNEDDAEKDGGLSASCASPLPAPEINEQIIKSPPEPTRVKSPEQIIMRSPDPVNWTVPLDTGKTFTVTQNVREGDPMMRPHSEIKASTPVEHPPPAPQSAPPELSEQSKLPNSKLEPDSIKESEDEDDDLLKSKSSVNSSVNPTSMAVPVEPAPTAAAPAVQNNPDVRYDKPVPGSTLRCLDDPTFESDINSPVANRNVASDVLDKARDRFDRFWGNAEGVKPDES
ncbi:serine/threonine-protein kinase pakA isoform X2 [Toxorhynchites rutilus septentrionalis]|uniref:serine/threonine-protein kinase pakA isoform X2 n=1 Tax=Toxorhynchites rutilus septentrionalis TaxID=329112 RepID=UPI0024785D88|nr:serine/threonine-protein kinase pakA isoform X2 [Toxorhynchites rutilus septentrionalis]